MLLSSQWYNFLKKIILFSVVRYRCCRVSLTGNLYLEKYIQFFLITDLRCSVLFLWEFQTVGGWDIYSHFLCVDKQALRNACTVKETTKLSFQPQILVVWLYFVKFCRNHSNRHTSPPQNRSNLKVWLVWLGFVIYVQLWVLVAING